MSLSASSQHPGGVNTLFADGSVRFIKNTVDPTTWRNLGTIAGGEVISSDAYIVTTMLIQGAAVGPVAPPGS